MSPQLLVEFTVPGTPVPKARPRVKQDRRGRNRTYTPDRTLEAEAAIQRHYIESAGCRHLDPSWRYRLEVEFHGPHASSDLDNLAKAVLDGLNGWAWADDKQVTELSAVKKPAPKDGRCTVVRILRVG